MFFALWVVIWHHLQNTSCLEVFLNLNYMLVMRWTFVFVSSSSWKLLCYSEEYFQHWYYARTHCNLLRERSKWNFHFVHIGFRNSPSKSLDLNSAQPEAVCNFKTFLHDEMLWKLKKFRSAQMSKYMRNTLCPNAEMLPDLGPCILLHCIINW